VTERGALLDALLADPAKAASLPADERQRLVAACAALTLALVAAPVLAVPAVPPDAAPGENGDELLTADEVAGLLKKSRHDVYALLRRADLAPAVVRVNRRTLRVRKAELLRLLVAGR